MGQAIRFYEAYGWEILGALLLIAVILLVVQMVRLRNLREQTAQLAKQVKDNLRYAPVGRKDVPDDPFRASMQEDRVRRQQRKETEETGRHPVKEWEMKEKSIDQDQDELISSVLEKIFP